jgi:hypothetical protein
MENKEELYSEHVAAGKRKYFIDLKQNSHGDKYIQISESRRNQDGGFDRSRILLYEEDFEKFNEALLKVMDKAK